MSQTYNLIVIGGGPAGYVAAIRAAQLGMKVVCIEKNATLGGTCLNVGCIPSKALLVSAAKYAEAKTSLIDHGIKTGSVSLDLSAMMARKDQIVQDNISGLDFLFRKNKIDRITGRARIAEAGQVVVDTEKGQRKISGEKILIASGSEAVSLPGIKIDEKKYLSSTGALSLTSVPKRLAIVGGGAIGLELGSIWNWLGAKVTIIEYAERILPTMDLEISQQMERILSQQGIEFRCGLKVIDAKKGFLSGITLNCEPTKGELRNETVETDVVLVATGRAPYTEGLGLGQIGITTDKTDRIVVDEHFETAVKGIFAIGDVIAGPMLAHKAQEEAVACVEMMAGQSGHVNYDAIPSVVYTMPEVASIGKTEDELKKENVKYKIGKFPFSANGRARAMNETEGFVKILADAKTDRILGAHIIGPEAGTLIAELALAMEYSASSEDIYRTCHAHPTLTEAIKEAALAVDGRAIHV